MADSSVSLIWKVQASTVCHAGCAGDRNASHHSDKGSGDCEEDCHRVHHAYRHWSSNTQPVPQVWQSEAHPWQACDRSPGLRRAVPSHGCSREGRPGQGLLSSVVHGILSTASEICDKEQTCAAR